MASPWMSPDYDMEDSTVMNFKRFDVVLDVSDHHYLNSNPSKTCKRRFANKRSSVNKAIMKEWRILEKNLPNSIYVRAYKTRLDLLRAVIVGPLGTPYHDGLFFFDIVLPPDFPKQLPKLYYHSHGIRLNHSLPETGDVCLSFNNSWGGERYGIWNTRAAGLILPILLCIQWIVLNDMPYFNDPDIGVWSLHSITKALMKESIAYSEDVFIESCKMMMHYMRSPPKNFESFVTEHFHARGEFVVAAIEAYSKGSCIVGQYLGSDSISSRPFQASAYFMSNVEKIYSDFEEASSSPFQMANFVEKMYSDLEEASSSPFQASTNFMSNAEKIYTDFDEAFTKLVVSAPGIKYSWAPPRRVTTVKKPKKKGAWKKIISAFKCICKK